MAAIIADAPATDQSIHFIVFCDGHAYRMTVALTSSLLQIAQRVGGKCTPEGGEVDVLILKTPFFVSPDALQPCDCSRHAVNSEETPKRLNSDTAHALFANKFFGRTERIRIMNDTPTLSDALHSVEKSEDFSFESHIFLVFDLGAQS